mmetsp:Transcript_54057/g.63165  ORF Transcript_54057/g.63165 Transcript_54057/m.63165 type:complete len:436 (+) Transcript_54057:77-1384(+)|eukprot:CAMPEP_0194352222 /NCGR_PEP_ID=MMETSP0174-20130528/615_1 /TAXON_ID=216777 /ORGANISM="Proboscia alata, Strain PI-D3" /LENGTH=435 /DNA_ID=CAMNT_0039120133 /DNA_START=84 /DNA_END=1391 /DNA_ORIENTATION=+
MTQHKKRQLRGNIRNIIFFFSRPSFVISLTLVATTTASLADTVRPEYAKFCYDDNSQDGCIGPSEWATVDVSQHQFQKFLNSSGDSIHNFDVNENECRFKEHSSNNNRPTPTNLYANEDCEDGHEILTRQMTDGDCRFGDLEFMITPHSLRAYNPFDDIACRRQHIDMPNGFPEKFYLQFIDVHLRSEHMIDGRRFDGEMMMYHLGVGDSSHAMAATSILLDGSGTRDDPQIQVFIDKWQEEVDRVSNRCETRRIMKENDELDEGKIYKRSASSYKNHNNAKDLASILKANDRGLRGALENNRDAYQRSTMTNATSSTDTRIPRNKMFPYQLWPTIYYYRYSGSIPFPPCSKAVHWRVFDEPRVVSKRQIKWLGRLLGSYVNETNCENESNVSKKTGEAFRPLQKSTVGSSNFVNQVAHCQPIDFSLKVHPPDEA